MKKRLPKIKDKKEFEKFFDETDLGDYLEEKDLKPAHLKFKNQDRLISIRLSSDLLNLLKKAAKKHRIKYQRLIKAILEENIVNYLR